MTPRYCVHCGGPEDPRAVGEGAHARCGDPRVTLEPPRYCADCARRMVVQITPSGWSARCSRHGETTSADAGSTG
ncbi:biotin synthase auxiliary protein BsaP [Saccharomonospora saliphila]